MVERLTRRFWCNCVYGIGEGFDLGPIAEEACQQVAPVQNFPIVDHAGRASRPQALGPYDLKCTVSRGVMNESPGSTVQCIPLLLGKGHKNGFDLNISHNLRRKLHAHCRVDHAELHFTSLPSPEFEGRHVL